MEYLKTTILRYLRRKTKKKRLTIELDETLYNELKRIAKKKRLSMGAVIRLLILDYKEED
ncbi:MAG: hypothetical protein DRP01_08545 [Archaeoglobales archaeon]|nr:MAG: hypothetical protein DRP01_08545 [Archaeoglobales archaeon]